MRILIAEDDPVSRQLLQTFLTKWGYEPVVTSSGPEAWEALQRPDAPEMAIVDWMMPEMEGPEVIRRQRDAEIHAQTPTYFILLTALDGKDDVVSGFDAGADDYVTKPFNKEELRARVHVGVRMIELRHKLADRVAELEQALSANKTLRGLLPICSYCKKIRDDQDYWTDVESYIQEMSDASFSHGVCPGCYDSKIKPQLDRMREQRAAEGAATSGETAAAGDAIAADAGRAENPAD